MEENGRYSNPAISGRPRKRRSTCTTKVNDPFLMPTRLNLPAAHLHKDALWITNEIKSVYKPCALPKEINQLNFRMKYSDAIELKKICDFIRANHWADVSKKKLKFRDGAWRRMRIDQLPPGKLKENFINAFATYLPSRRQAYSE